MAAGREPRRDASGQTAAATRARGVSSERDTDGSDGDTQDPRITARLAEVLARAPILFDRVGATARAGALPGSEATKDASVPLGHHVRILAIDHLTTGIEHLVMWHRLLVAGVQPYGCT